MAKAAAKLLFFLDNNIPDSIGRFLQRRGHGVYRQRFHIPADSEDPLVATTAMKAGRILVTWDKDFNGQRFQQPRYAALSRIGVSGDGPTLLLAVREHIELIELKWGLCERDGVRMIALVKVGQIRFRS